MQNSVSNENVQPNLKHCTLPWLSWYYITFPIWSFAFLKWKRQKYPLLKRGKGVSMCFFCFKTQGIGYLVCKMPCKKHYIYHTHVCTHTLLVYAKYLMRCVCVCERERTSVSERLDLTVAHLCLLVQYSHMQMALYRGCLVISASASL